MISKVEDGKVERSQAFVENTFKIKASAKAFDILSSGLYSDKITAIIRELSCNAYDSHIQAGNTEPFLVHLPNSLEPFFSIRDYGTGLSKQDVIQIFTTYFESTKTNSNDFVGCLGLGSKSPFSYTDSFSVTSFYNGTKLVYNAFKNEQNLPTIVLMSEEATAEKNGVEIMFSVKNHDCYEFVRKSPAVYQYFKIQPKVVGAEFESIVVDYFMHKDGWSIRSNKYGNGSNGARAIMGNIAYPLNDYPASDLSNTTQNVLSMNIDIHFDIGELDVSASREKLSYDTATKNNIKIKLIKVTEEIITELENKVSVCKSLWDARVMMYSLKRGEYAIFSSFISYANVTWNGVKLTDSNNAHTDYVLIKDLQDKVDAYIYRPNHRKDTLDITEAVPVKDGISFFMKDIGKLIIPRCCKYFADNNYEKHRHTLVLFKEKVAGGMDELKKLLGMDGATVFQNLSTLTYDATSIAQASPTNPKNKMKVLKYNNTGVGSHRNFSSFWDATDVDMEEGGVYVEIDRYQVNGNHWPNHYINTYKHSLELVGETLPVVIGVKPSERSKFIANKEWQTLHDFTVEKMSQHIAKHAMDENIVLDHVNSRMEYHHSSRHSSDVFAFLRDNVEVFKDHAELKDAIELINKVKGITDGTPADKFKEALKAINNLNRTDLYDKFMASNKELEDKYVEKLTETVNYVANEYPLIKFIPSYHIGDNMKDIVNYINSMRNIKNGVDKTVIV